MQPAIAIVGMACEYPDAHSPAELWDNVLSQRRAFRPLPAERLAYDYRSADPQAADKTYVSEAGVLEGYEFDRVKFRVVGSTFRSADLTHWLALDVAARALDDAGFVDGTGLPKESTGVIVGNTLTGEFTRAGLMRLRWPYVQRVVDAALQREGWQPTQRREFLQQLENEYKSPFPTIGEESLAGGLANTIAGRICNYFDLNGGGYTVDGACASSLLATATACSQLLVGDIDVALVGGVDLSLDPFELVGFAKTGALATAEMRVFDARSNGFWPGEGCGMAVLMRAEEALAQGRRIHALIRGWGISSDGSGGITRPEVEGQLLAFRRAYQRAGFAADSVAYFEGHGTGTAVGDATELKTIIRARQVSAHKVACPAAIGSIKANIGHTKAAAGVAGLIKATLALREQILPPTTGSFDPHPELSGANPALRVLTNAEPWPPGAPVRAAVSAMGFGGINAHVVLEGVAAQPRRSLRSREQVLSATPQDAELILLAAKDSAALLAQIDLLLAMAQRISRAELTDLAAELTRILQPGSVRAALIVSKPAELCERLEQVRTWLLADESEKMQPQQGLFLSKCSKPPAIGFVFPGQGAPANLGGGVWGRRFGSVACLYQRADLPSNGDGVLTSVAQPAIVTATLAGLATLQQFDLDATVGIGHSLGELSALFWAGGLDETALLRVARVRGQAMVDVGNSSAAGASTGSMASIAASANEVQHLMNGAPLSIACLNAPLQTVVAGEFSAVQQLIYKASNKGIVAKQLAVSHAFHSPLVAAAAPVLAAQLAQENFRPLHSRLISTVTGTYLGPEEDVRPLLYRQITEPVRFTEAMAAAPAVDLWIEVGPGRTLNGLVSSMSAAPVISLDAGGASLKGLLQAVGAAFVLGASINHHALFAGRSSKPFPLHHWQPRFLTNPCELTAQTNTTLPPSPLAPPREFAPVPLGLTTPEITQPLPTQQSPDHFMIEPSIQNKTPPLTPTALQVVRQLVAQRAELPETAVGDNDRLLSDLHLNSISVGQLVAEAARQLQLSPPTALTDYANVTVADAAQALEEIAQHGGQSTEAEGVPAGVESWVRAFTVELVEEALPTPTRLPTTQPGTWQLIAPQAYPLTNALQHAIRQLPGDGIVLCLPAQPSPADVSGWLQTVRNLAEQRTPVRFVLVQQGGTAAALARTVHLEMPQIAVCVLQLPIDHPAAPDWIIAEARATQQGYGEAHYDQAGVRRVPRLQLLPMLAAADVHSFALQPDDVLLVTGGGKGITAECAMALAKHSGCRLALLGRAEPAHDSELAANLQRMSAAGITWHYLAADVVDAAAVQQAVTTFTSTLGAITGILHGAARNVPKLLTSLTADDFAQTFAPKLQGLENLLAAVTPSQLRLLLTFGSIIARTGMKGEADYGLANEWLAQRTAEFQRLYPACRTLCVEWSVWEGAGMGAKLGRLEALSRQGITPISIAQGVTLLQQLLLQPSLPPVVVVTGRFGDAPTLAPLQVDLPFWRFLEETKVHTPGVELIVEATLGQQSDPYLADHVFRGEPLFLAVLGQEAMAQVAMAVAGETRRPTLLDAQFLRPIVVPGGVGVRIRLAALLQPNGDVAVALRSAESAFQVDHFRVTCRFESLSPSAPPFPVSEFPAMALKPAAELYGGLFFHQGRFVRVEGYFELAARRCVAQISPTKPSAWFDRYLPQTLVLGDPGMRDAMIHGIQVCVPQGFLLPVGVERLIFGPGKQDGVCWLRAEERSQNGERFVYDVEVTDEAGLLLERWEGLQLQMVSGAPVTGEWSAYLLAPYLTRHSETLGWSERINVGVEIGDCADRQVRSDRAIQRALGQRLTIQRRPDGAPEAVGSDLSVSATHCGPLTLAVAGAGVVGCDVEEVVNREIVVWQGLLGAERCGLAEIMMRQANLSFDSAATRVWSAMESMRKAGLLAGTPLLLEQVLADGWVLLRAGTLQIATCQLPVRGFANPLTVALAVGK